jgi:hypothetical protein
MFVNCTSIVPVLTELGCSLNIGVVYMLCCCAGD